MSSGDAEMIRQLREKLCSTENEKDELNREVEDLTFKLDELANSAATAAGGAGAFAKH